MADDAAFSGPKGKGPPWLLIGGGVVAVLGVMALAMRSAGTGSGTTAAGTSINAALGSLQEEQMNLLGTVQAGAMQNSANFSAASGQLSDATTAILNAISDQGTATQAQITGAVNTINNNTNAGNKNLMSAISDALGQLLNSQQNLLSQINQVDSHVQGAAQQEASNAAQSQAQVNQALQGILQLIHDANQLGVTTDNIQRWTNEIKARLQQGDYSAPFHGPSYQPWTTATSHEMVGYTSPWSYA